MRSILIVAAALFLSGCGSPGSPATTENLYETAAEYGASSTTWMFIAAGVVLFLQSRGIPLGDVLGRLLNIVAPPKATGGESVATTSTTAEASRDASREAKFRAYLVCRDALAADAESQKALDLLLPKIIDGGQA